MARPRAFDQEQALDAAMAVFWKNGYGASSMQQLLDAMAINRGSLYAAFGDKAGLFRQVMRRYQQQMQSLVLSMLTRAEDPVAGVRQVFQLSVLALPDEQRALGCLLVNAVNELSPLDPELAADAQAHLSRLETALIDSCRRARDAGRLVSNVTPEQAGHLLTTAMTGLRVQTRRGEAVDKLADSVEPLMNLLFKEH